MIEVRRSTRARTEDLWALLSDLDNWAGMLPTMQQVTRVDDGPIGPGGRFEVQQPGLPKAVYEITHWQPGRAFTWVSSAIGVRTTASHRLEPEPDGTGLTLSIDWSGPLAWIARLLAGSKARRMVEQEADTFVRLAEHAERRG
jgi:Polyketide cyclase / dehydrase and lipid transport